MKPVSLKRDNARVNRADGKCKLVKLESDTMGGHDHPTTSQPYSLGRFGSTLCYPDSRVIRFPYPIGLASRSRDEADHNSYNLRSRVVFDLQRFEKFQINRNPKQQSKYATSNASG